MTGGKYRKYPASGCRALEQSTSQCPGAGDGRRRRRFVLLSRSPAREGRMGQGRIEDRELGKTGLRVSALGFGCGNVGGLMIRGSVAERERAVARAVELGINYFDTAPAYGDGQSEQNLGAALRSRRATVYVGTKFRLDAADLRDVRRAIGHSLDASLKRLGMERVDLLQLHNNIFGERGAQP